LQEIRRKAMVTPDWRERDKMVFEMIRIHIEHGPFIIGTAGNYYRVGVVSDRMKNVPRREDLPLGGYVNPWFGYEDTVNPMQFFIREE
jgi:peptide/nickel transport system substrate-binding protein